jgi:hypothetical protein
MVNLSSPTSPAIAKAKGPRSLAKSGQLPDTGRIWTVPKMMLFINTLANTGSVSVAAKCAGMSRQSAYGLRNKLIDQPFDLAWEAALEFGFQQVAHEALDRALNGTLIPVYYKGEKVDERRVFNERATLNLMLAAPHIGRSAAARGFATRHWPNLLQRLEDGPLTWTEEELARSSPGDPDERIAFAPGEQTSNRSQKYEERG